MNKKLFFFLVALMLNFNLLKAQHIKVFTHYDFSKSFTNNLSQTSFAMGEFLQFHKIADFRFLAGVRFTANNLKTSNLTAFSGDVGQIGLKSTTLRSNISVPIGAEIAIKGLGIGMSLELLSLGFQNSINLTKFSNLPTTAVYVYPNGTSTLFSSPSKRNLSSQIYIIYTVNESLSLIAGIDNQKVIYNLKDTDKVTFGSVGHKGTSPFVTLRINVEK